jgi:hypothetical protein
MSASIAGSAIIEIDQAICEDRKGDRERELSKENSNECNLRMDAVDTDEIRAK